ncbi:tryptophan synthase beta subunit-like PLP-dependent enzyme [Phyllosticta capitalensis]|uniref:tryptophan synthase beta subunit-like PLP-dependent enzyme n=1 Tax=Phyllosticta capitalensis TaxID=121624 RepID=UPI0031301364
MGSIDGLVETGGVTMIGPDFGTTAASVNTHYGTTKAKTAAIEYGLDLSPVFVEAVAESFPKVAPQPVPSAKPADGVATGYGQGGVDGESLAAPPPDSKPWIVTPLVESKALSKAVGCRILLKLDLLQPSGSFKLRGISTYILHHLQNHPRPHLSHFYSASGGNAGLACVVAATTLGRPATIVTPKTTSPSMLRRLRDAGAAAIIVHGDTLAMSERYIRDVLMGPGGEGEHDGVFVPPFDDALIWSGNSSIVDEVAEQMPQGSQPDAIVCSVGGGGLLAGLLQGLRRRCSSPPSASSPPWSPRATTVVAAETEGAASLAAALHAGRPVTLAGISSQARSLGCVRVAQKAYDEAVGTVQQGAAATTSPVKSVVLSDAEAARGCVVLADEDRLMVELACGVSVAVCLDDRLPKVLGREVTPDMTVVIVVCGGCDVDVGRLAGWRETCGGLVAAPGPV